MANIPFLNNAYFSAKVGIGTDSPNKPLTIQTNDSSWGSMRIYRDSATLGETAIGFFGTSTQATNQAWVIGEGGWGNVGDFIIGNENGGAGGNVRMLIQRDGNVGIGTTSPSTLLEISGNSQASTPALRINCTDSSVQLNQVAGAVQFSVNDASTPGAGVKTSINSIALNSIGSRYGLGFNTTSGVNNVERMRIDSDGNVGIGTTSPGGALDVVGTYLSTLFRVSNTDADATTKYGSFMGRHYLNSEENITGMLLTSSSSNTGGSVAIGGGITSANAVNVIKFFTAANNTTLLGSERMRITNAGNVGIGTTNPARNVHVHSDTLTDIHLTNTASGQLLTDGGTITLAGTDFLVNNREVGNLRLFTSAAERMRITSGGKVGIGTTNPDAPLTVTNNAVSSYIINVNMADDVDGGGFYEANGGVELYLKDTSGSGQVKLTSSGLSYLNGGNVGIGTNSPATKLQVAGGIQMADDTATASAAKVGTLKYRVSGNNSYVDMCMQTGATTYAWINIVQNNW